MSTALNNLNFMVSLTDRVSGPMGKVMNAVDQASNKFQSGAQKIGYGVAGIAGAAYSVNRLLEPTKEMQRALGDVKSLDVADDALAKLQRTALEFSTKYGGTAADFVKSSYNIKSAINNLKDNELPEFTKMAAILAKGTKAQVGDMTSYMGTMYNIFQKNADQMGKTNWAQQLVGQTAMAVKIFKAEGKDFADAYMNLGAKATGFGISMAEQLAVLGSLKATMPGGMAGTRYVALLDNIGRAEEGLGLKLTNKKGEMLPILDVLERVRQKYGEIKTVAQFDELGSKNGFGTSEAVQAIGLLMPHLDELRANINLLSKTTGMEDAMKMAQTIADADPWAKMKAGTDAISISIGTKLLPVIDPLLTSIHGITNATFALTDAYPNLSKWIGIVTVGIFGFIGSLALLTVLKGYTEMVKGGWLILKTFAGTLWTETIPAVWSFTAALLANPMTWWVLGIGAAVALTVIYWDELTAAFKGWSDSFMVGAEQIKVNFFAFMDTLKQAWTQFTAWIESLNPFDNIMAGFNKVSGAFGAAKAWATTPINFGSAPVGTGPTATPKGGGILKQMSSVMNANKNTTVGNVTVNNYGSPMSGAKLRDELLFAG